MHIFYGKSRIIFLHKKVQLTRKGIEKGFIFKGKFRNQLHWFTNSPISVCIHRPACLLRFLVKCFHSSRTYAFEIFMHKTTYAAIYLCSHVHNVLDACISITRASGRGLSPGIGEFFGPCEMASPIDECHLGPKNHYA